MPENLDDQILSRRSRASTRAGRRLFPIAARNIFAALAVAGGVGFVGTNVVNFENIPDEWIWGAVGLGAFISILLTLNAVRESHGIQMGMSARATLRDIDRQYPEN